MITPNLETADADALAPVLLAAIQRFGQLGRIGAVALSRIVDDGDAHFDEGASWITEVAAGDLPA